jgi:hypothetical protein
VNLSSKVQRARLVLIGWWLAWPFFHAGLIWLPPWFFEHVLVALSVYAIVATKRDDLHTCQVEESRDSGDGQSLG